MFENKDKIRISGIFIHYICEISRLGNNIVLTKKSTRFICFYISRSFIDNHGL